MDLSPWTPPGTSRDPSPGPTAYAALPRRSTRTPLPGTPETTFRVGELERAAACDALAEHYAAGRLDPAELDDRLARAMAARTQADLRVLFRDLGPRRGVDPVAPEPAPVERRAPGTLGTVGTVALPLLVLSVLLAGGMLLVLGAVNPLLFVAALVGGTATAVAGSCATVLGQAAWRRR